RSELIRFRETDPSPNGGGRRRMIRSNGVVFTEHADWTGRITHVDVLLPPLTYGGLIPGREGVERMRVDRLRSHRGALILPSSRFRDLRIPLPDTLLAPGDSWTDTLAFEALPGEGLEEIYREVRRITVLSDTVLGARRAYRLRTEGEVRYELRDVRYLGPYRMAVHRTASGTNVGTVAVDARNGLRMAGADTAWWSGEAVLHDPAMGPLTSGAVFQRVRGWRHFEPEEYAAHQDSVRGAMDADPGAGGMRPERVVSLGTELVGRFMAGDTAVADSLAAAWRESPNGEQAGLARRIPQWARDRGSWQITGMDSLFWALHFSRGDTAPLVLTARRSLARN
ncbi:MAG TPA: hypothetical protein VLA43_00790, partial [Longimicrobiales bacterium]|nr:hypothetical protein [Longimicrobiales bacterium]